MIKEFKEFIAKGNVFDLAVGIIIGGAFGKIVSALVDNILMPVLGIISGGIDFSKLSVKIGEATLAYGAFIQSVIDFVIIAICLFFLIKAINRFKRPKPIEPPTPIEIKEIDLLKEIRDLLKNNVK